MVPVPDLKEHHLEQLRFGVLCFQLQFGSVLLGIPSLKKQLQKKQTNLHGSVFCCSLRFTDVKHEIMNA